MKSEIRFDKVDFDVTASIKKGRLVGVLTAEIDVTPAAIARVFNFKRQNAALNLVIEAPQLALDLQFTEIKDPEVEEEGASPITLGHFLAEVKEGDELPFRVEIDHLRGAGRTPRQAVIAALRAGSVIDNELAESANSEEIADYLRATHPSNGAVEYKFLRPICDVLVEDSFDVPPVEEGEASAPAAETKRGRRKAGATA